MVQGTIGRRPALTAVVAIALLFVGGCSDDAAVAPAPSGPTDADVSDDSSGASAVPSTEVEPFPLPDRPWSVREPGPFRIGSRVFEEPSFVPRAESDPRRVRFRIWYPTTETEGLPSRYARGLLARREAIRDASIAAEAGERLPLLLFSHGNSGLAEQNWFMMEFFASHGWIVASPDHAQNTFFDTGGAINLRSAVHRPQDMSFILDMLLDMPEDDPLHGRVDPDAIAISGHSFGGFTSLAITGATFAVDELIAICEDPAQSSRFCDIVDEEAWIDVFRQGFLDERIGVSIPLTPGGHDAFRGGESAIRIPTLLMTGARDATLPNAQEGDPIWENMRGPDHMRLDFLDAGHFTFSNMCEIFGTVVENDGCEADFMPFPDAYLAINAYTLAFARFHLFGDDTEQALLSGEESLFPSIVLSRPVAQ